ncbi:MAG: LamG domain-containing protein [Verrucomicrobia bacterium]|nr:MAG: LamG domain-containing protein [Verrucomicrobiota bacterium]
MTVGETRALDDLPGQPEPSARMMRPRSLQSPNRALSRSRPRLSGLIRFGGFLIFGFNLVSSACADVVLPGLVTNLVCRYDFEHPVTTNAARETDLGFSKTDLNLINGGAAMRVADGAYPGSTNALQTQQINSTTSGNDDWKAGVYQTNGVASLSAFASVAGITLMGWVKPTGTNPNLDTTTAATNDYYNAIGLFGLLSGNSEGHGVRALLEIITVGTNYQLVALGRRLDSGNSLTLAATNDWPTLLPSNTWTHLAATFDFDNGVMALYRNGSPLGATNTTTGNRWNITAGTDVTSATSPAGIKLGGSYPQNTQEFNALNGRVDDLMFFNRVLTAGEVQQQFASFFAVTSAPPVLAISQSDGYVTLSWPTQSAGFALESRTNLAPGDWLSVSNVPATNGQTISATLPVSATQQFFRLNKP